MANSTLQSSYTNNRSIVLGPGDSFQTALNNAVYGDTIVLDKTGTYAGFFHALPKSGSGFINITTNGTIPSIRVSPSDVGEMPTIRSLSGGEPALQFDPFSGGYNLLGLHFPENPGGFGEIISIGTGETTQNTLAQVPSNISVDRCYIHGGATVGQKRGIGMNGFNLTVIKCYISDIKANGQDSQAVGGFNGPGTYLIDDNYLEAAGENILFGGADASIVNLVVTNITVTNNHCFKQPSWRGSQWSVKNLFELKNAQNVTISNNIFENCWLAGQDGYAIVLTPRNQDGTNPWVVVQNIDFINNIIKHVSTGVSILGTDDINPSQLTNNINVSSNLFYDVSSANWGGSGRFVLIGAGADRVTLNHNTCIHDGSTAIYAYGAPMTNFICNNNIMFDNLYGIFGDGSSPGNTSIAQYFPGGKFNKNIIVAAPAGGFPVNNYYPANSDAVGFVDYPNGNYGLSNSSPYHLGGTDGLDPGV